MRTLSSIILLAVVALVGCQGDDKSPTSPASGVVLVDDKPVEGLEVKFFPPEGKMAQGVTGPDGKFTLTTYEENDGALIGQHKVTIVFVPPLEESSENAGESEPVESPIPEQYASQETSDLTREVKAGDDNVFEFKLTK